MKIHYYHCFNLAADDELPATWVDVFEVEIIPLFTKEFYDTFIEQLQLLADGTDLSIDDIRRKLKRRGLPESGDDIHKLHICLALARAGLSTVKIMGAYNN